MITTKQITDLLEMEKRAAEGEPLANSYFIASFRNIARELLEEVIESRKVARFYGGETWQNPMMPECEKSHRNYSEIDDSDLSEQHIGFENKKCMQGGKRARAHLDRFVKGEK